METKFFASLNDRWTSTYLGRKEENYADFWRNNKINNKPPELNNRNAEFQKKDKNKFFYKVTISNQKSIPSLMVSVKNEIKAKYWNYSVSV
jgi:hypothetical protein